MERPHFNPVRYAVHTVDQKFIEGPRQFVSEIRRGVQIMAILTFALSEAPEQTDTSQLNQSNTVIQKLDV